MVSDPPKPTFGYIQQHGLPVAPRYPLFAATQKADGTWWVIKIGLGNVIEQWITLDDKRCTEECAHGVAEALNRVYAPMPCPYDTDGDGNCGRLHCPYCGHA
jgi:hypothetical protein